MSHREIEKEKHTHLHTSLPVCVRVYAAVDDVPCRAVPCRFSHHILGGHSSVATRWVRRARKGGRKICYCTLSSSPTKGPVIARISFSALVHANKKQL